MKSKQVAVDREYRQIKENYESNIMIGEDGEVTLEQVKSLIEQAKLEIYPVGSIYISTSNTNPSQIIGGTWEKYAQGRTLIGEGEGTDTRSEKRKFDINTTGGEYKHQLTVSEMPAHTHSFKTGGQGIVLGVNGSGLLDKNTGFSHEDNSGWWSGYSKDISYIDTTGGGDSHNNIQPYIVTYMWKRIS